MRNQPQELTTLGLANVCRVSQSLFNADSLNEPVRLTYVKRDGTESESTGLVGFFTGDYRVDTFSVNIATENKGRRTINIARILDVWSA